MTMSLEIISTDSDDGPINHLCVIDSYLDELESNNINSQLILDGFLRAVLGSLDISNVDKPAEKVFDQQIAPHNRRFIAICFLRLLSVNEDIFEKDSTLRVRVFSLFDDVFKDTIYKALKIDSKEQTYKKITILQDAIEEIESGLEVLINSISIPSDVINLRQEYMKRLNSTLAKIFIHPFLPSELIIRLMHVFQAVEEYIASASDTSTVVSFHKTIEQVKEFNNEAKKFGTKFSIKYFSGLAEKALMTVQRHFEESPAGKPANLTISTSEKKYPLHATDETFKLLLSMNNNGPGHGFNVHIFIDECSDNLQISETKYSIGIISLRPATTFFEISCKVLRPEEIALMKVRIQWTNSNSESCSRVFELEVLSQKPGIKWEILAGEEPYSLEPISSDEDLIGRTDILLQLLAQVQAKNVGSSYVYGQKRVGKTSIVKSLQTRLKKNFPQTFFPIYIEGGRCIDTDAKKTVNNLGTRICKEIAQSDLRFSYLLIPTFDGALPPLYDFLEDAHRLAPDSRFLFILDEFDELPLELFKRESIGKALFLSLRGISSLGSFGFILVGGEKMEFIINSMGDQLNKFEAFRVDYFNKDICWNDFQNLVRIPIASWFEITDDALEALYELTSGNPYFTNVICKSMFSMMVARRDAHITRKEVIEAMVIAVQRARSNSFQHFWQDGITETGARGEEIIINRKKILISLGEIVRKGKSEVSKTEFIETAVRHGLTEEVVKSELREFVRRNVMEEDDNKYRCKAIFFQEWLKEQGISEIMTTCTDYEMYLRERVLEEEAYVRPDEITKLIKNWGPYQGKTITSEEVRTWLNQLGDNRNQRLMFQILKHIRFYGDDVIRAKTREAHGIVKRDIVYEIKQSKKKRNDILISYLDGPAKSGAHFAKLYADENKIYVNSVVEKTKIDKALEENQDIKAIVFMDDIMGTGGTAITHFKWINSQYGEKLRNVKLYFITVCGFNKAKLALMEYLDTLSLEVNVHVCDNLDEGDRCFTEVSRTFEDVQERLIARKICYDKGQPLEPKSPLGYGDCQALVVFEYNCPNNSLPILWKEDRNWVALFPRQY